MLKKRENRRNTTAIVVTIVTAILFLFLFLFLGINHRKEVYNDSKILATEISRKAAYETQVYLSNAILIANSLEQNVELVQRLHGSRKEIDRIIHSVIEENPNFLGIWNLWEPNAFDGKDFLYKKDTLYNDQGILGFSYFRNKGEIFYEVMYPTDYSGQYYSLPKKLMKEVITEPYYFAYSGYKQGFYGTSVSVPIIIGNKFHGVIGIDIDLNYLQKKLNKIRPYNSGYLSLISNNGAIVTHIDTTLINKSFFDYINKDDTLSYKAIVEGEELNFEIKSEFTGEDVMRMFYPIIIGKDNKPWNMMIEIPLKKATYRSTQLLYIAIVTLLTGLSLLVYLIFNISERRKYLKELVIAKTKAEESDRLKTAFLNNISHEIRTPLNGIIGFSDLLVTCDKKEEIQDYNKIIHKSSNQLLSIINNVIRLSKIQTHQEKVEISEFNLAEVLQTEVGTFKSAAKEKDLKLLIKTPGDKLSDYTITTDQNKFKQVISYLLNNSIKYTESGFVEVGFRIDNDKYSVYVKDSGIGISAENAKDIFDYFKQGKLSSEKTNEGLGVGLSISKSFIDMLGGSIWFESEINKGTTFYFSLPIVFNK